MQCVRAYFGRNIGNSGYVSDSMIRRFLADEVTSRYLGFTVFHAEGFWEGKSERSFVLEFLTDKPSSVADLAAAYAVLYKQESVLVHNVTTGSTVVVTGQAKVLKCDFSLWQCVRWSMVYFWSLFLLPFYRKK